MPWAGTTSLGDDGSTRRQSLFKENSFADRGLKRLKYLIPKRSKELPDDYYYNPNLHEGITRRYLNFTTYSRTLVANENFNYAIIFVIILAGINIGVQSYDQMSDVYILEILDVVILMVFSFEVVVKILAEGLAPWMYFTGDDWKWNNFDFGIVFMSLPFWNGLFGGGSLALLRLVRLMRLAKLIKKVPQLQMIVEGLTGGLSSIGYILLLLVLVFYLFAVLGFYMFHMNDPFHFKSLPISMVTLFRCATLDAWSDVMYLNNFGCDGYDYLYVSEEDQSEANRLFWCENPKKQYVLSSIYFVVFTVISALVMLSLFIGAVTLSMNDSLNELKELAAETKKSERMKKALQKKFAAQNRIEMRKQNSMASSQEHSSSRLASKLAGLKPTTPEKSSKRASSPQMSDMVESFNASDFSSPDSSSPSKHHNVWSSLDSVNEHAPTAEKEQEQTNPSPSEEELDTSLEREEFSGNGSRRRIFSVFLPDFLKEAIDESAKQQTHEEDAEIGRMLRIGMGEIEHGIEDEPKSLSAFTSRFRDSQDWRAKHLLVAEYCKFIGEHPRFTGLVTIVICLAGINVGAQTDTRITGVPAAHFILQILDRFILAVFTTECVVKIIGEGVKPWVYFRDNWNKFDFVIVVGSYIPGAGSLLTILRLLRLLRVLKLVKSLPQLAVIVNALIMGMSSIGYIGLILFLCFYVFAILGMILFKQNDPFHFSNLHISMFSLFRASTLDDWSEIMYVNMYGCDRYPGVYDDFPEMCDNPKALPFLSTIYFLAFIIIGAQVLLTLFIGVVTTSMEEAQSLQDLEMKQERQLKSLKVSLDLTDVQIRYFKAVFSKLDLDGGGTIEEEEMSIGLAAVGDLLEGGPAAVEEKARKADTTGKGIDLITFIIIMCDIPSCRRKRLVRRIVRRWMTNKKKGSLFSRLKAAAPALRVKALEEVFRKNAHDINNLLFGKVSLDGKHEESSRKSSDDAFPVRRRSGTWIPSSDHEVVTVLDIGKMKSASRDSGDSSSANVSRQNSYSPNPNGMLVKALSEKRMAIDSGSPMKTAAKNSGKRSMSVGNIQPPKPSRSRGDITREFNMDNNPKKFRPDAVREFDEDDS